MNNQQKYSHIHLKHITIRLSGPMYFQKMMLFFLVLGLPRILYSQEWHMKQAPVMTSWANKIDTSNVLSEYPRPQLTRKEWMNLNGIWQFQSTASMSYPSGKLSGKILVPFAVESAISGVMVHSGRIWYKRFFTVPPQWEGKKIMLHFGAVDWECEVFINGTTIGRHSGGFDPFSFNITSYLTGGQQEIAVRVYDPTDQGGQPRGKQVLNPNGIWYTPVTGIWQTVWLEPVPDVSIENIKITPDVDHSKVLIKVNSSSANSNYHIEIHVKDSKTIIQTNTGIPNAEQQITITNPKLWSPEDPFLYDLKVYLKNGNTTVDSVESYFGMRKISIGKCDNYTRIVLNNKFVFQFGPLDQGWWPDGLYTAPTDSALRWDILQMKEFGFNMVRKHIKVEPARWYYWCDKLGLVVWQDMPSGNNSTSTDKDNYEDELRRIIQNLENVPSIIMWIVFNEGWGQYDTQRVTELAVSYDHSRLVSNASGWTDALAGHILDSHSYPNPSCLRSDARAVVNGEFGGIGLQSIGHMWNPNSWGYEMVYSSKELEQRLDDFTQQIEGYITEGLSASVYTQLTDVEQEINGLITYDRKVIKVDVPAIKKMFGSLISSADSNYIFKPVLSTAENASQTWKYTFSEPFGNWFSPTFDDSRWSSGRNGFGTYNTPGAIVGTQWNTSDIWLRSSFIPQNVNLKNIENLRLRLYHDENADIYINGIWACSFYGYEANYFTSKINSNALASIKNGEKNTIAVYCHQTTGGQFIDVGLYMKVNNSDSLSYILDSKSLTKNNDEDIVIYPNPSPNGELNVRLPERFLNNAFEISVVNSSGKLMATRRLKNSVFNLPKLEKGTYFIEIKNLESLQIYYRKIIVLK